MLQILDKAPVPFKGTEVHTFDNGLKVILRDDPTVPVVAMHVWARCGAVDESPHIYGISHGLEHMVFKGTPSRSAGEITRLIEANGGLMNAATQLETTHYYIDIPSYGAAPALDILADTILHPTFPQEELERERLVILEEIHRRDDSPDATLWDEFISNMFDGTPYGVKVIGSKETVSALSRSDLMTYYTRYYVPENLTIVMVGDFKKKKVLGRLHELFDKMPAGRTPPKVSIDLAHSKPKPGVVLERPVQLSYLAMGFPTIGLGHEDLVALDLLADVVGGGRSARLYQKLREESQTVLSVTCDFIPFDQKGVFALFAETLPKKSDKAVAGLLDEIKAIEKNPVTPAELNRAKARIKSDWLHGSETPHGQASTLGSLSVLNHVALIDDYLAKIDSSTTDDLMAAYRKHVAARPFYLTQINPAP